MKQTAQQTAIAIEKLLHNSGQTRARISEHTVKILSGRKTLRIYFKASLRDELDDLGIALIELDRGGFGIIYATTLEGAKPITIDNSRNILKIG